MRPPGRRRQPVADGGPSAFDLAQPEAQGSDPTFGICGGGDDEWKAVSTLASFELALNEGATLVMVGMYGSAAASRTNGRSARTKGRNTVGPDRSSGTRKGGWKVESSNRLTGAGSIPGRGDGPYRDTPWLPGGR
jgi:hypothetical protein